MDIAAWLRGLGLEQYEPAFRAHEIDAAVLPDLTDEHLKGLGLPLGPRLKLLKAIASLRAGAPVSPAGAGPQAAAPAERRQLTVLFCDLVGSTELAARLDPEDLREVIGAYHRCVAAAVRRFDGYIAKYMGDGVVAYFGYPRSHEDNAERAVRAGLTLVAAVRELAPPQPGTGLRVRVGIATGLAVVGDLLGEGAAREEAVIGDTPALAARLQALAEPETVLIAPLTRELVGARFLCDDLGPHPVKGIAAPVRVWRVRGASEDKSRFEATHPRGLTPLVGRDQELGVLLGRWELARVGVGQVVLLSGEPGIGKSRLVETLALRLAAEPHTRLRYQCSPYFGNTAFHPVIEQLRQAAGFAPEDPPERRLDKLAALLARSNAGAPLEAPALIADLLSLPTGERYPPLELDGRQRKQRTIAALVEGIIGLSKREPVLAVVEDAHWIDPSTLEMLAVLVERVREARLLLVVTFRPDLEPPSWGGNPHVTGISLNRLSRGQSAAIAQRLSGARRLPEAVLDQIVARTDGTPLFVEELTKAVLESGLLRDHADAYVFDAGPLPPLAIPATLQDSLMARLDRLAPVKEIAQIGAALGRSFSYDLLAAVAALPEPQLRAGLDRLVESELVFRRGTPPQAVYTFKHALVQEAAHASLLRARRQQLHARIADALQESARRGVTPEPEGLARHYIEAGLPEQAIPHLLAAGERAAARSAGPEAIGHFTRALELLSALPEGEARDRQELRLRVALAVPLIAVHGFGSTEVEACAKRAKALSDLLGDSEHRFTVVRVLWNSSLMRRPVPETLALSAELLRLAEVAGDPAQLAVARRSRGYSLFFACRLAEARSELSKGIELADSVADAARFWLYGEHPAMVCRVYSGWTLAVQGEADRALAMAQDGVAIARRLGNVHTLAWSLCCLALVQAFRRDALAVRATAGEAIELAGTHRLPQWLAWSTFFHGWSIAAGGDLGGGGTGMERGLARWHATGAVLSSTLLHGLFAAALGEAGDLERARAELRAAFAHLDGFGERYVEAELHRIEAAFRRRENGHPQAVEAALRRAMEIAAAQDARLWQLRAASDLARLWRGQGRGDQARGLLAPVYGRFSEGFATQDLRDAKALLDELG